MVRGIKKSCETLRPGWEEELCDLSLLPVASPELRVNRIVRSPRILCMCYLLELVGIKLFHQAVL